MRASNSIRTLSGAAARCALVYVLISVTSRHCNAWQAAGPDVYVDDSAEDADAWNTWGNPCDQCGGRPGLLHKIICHLPFHGCGLTCCGLTCHSTDAAEDESQDEDPSEQEFPRFHPVPIRPVFAPRDGHGMPIPPAPDPSLIEMPVLEPSGAPLREELAPPAPLGEQSPGASRGAKARTHHASWVFQQPNKRRYQEPTRNPRPQFEVQEHPRKTARKKR